MVKTDFGLRMMSLLIAHALQRQIILFLRPDPIHLLHGIDEDFAIANLARPGMEHDRIDG